MTISLNWLRQYLDFRVDTSVELTPDQIGELLTELGLELEGMHEVEQIRGGLQGVVTGHVLECHKHPNADKLSLTKVDIGAAAPLSIVCGAPNVAAGQKVLVATVGTTLYPLGSEQPLTIKKAKVRGEDSEGMICAADELGLGEDHSGIMVLPKDTPTGIPAAQYFQLEKDVVYEIGLTPNRSDATCHIGIARDLAAALKIRYGHSGQLHLPSVEAFTVHSHDLPIQIEVLQPEACPRYAGVCIRDVTVGESPKWLKQRLEAIGVRSINNVVDITNFVLHELGQPLHAFDYDAIAGQKVIVRTLPEGTTFLALDETERKLSAEDLMICDGHSTPMCMGGVFGGLHSGVKPDTQRIFLESAHFSPRYIRRSSMRHNLRTEAAKVFEKGSDPNAVIYALQRAALLICELAGGRIASDIIDIYPEPIRRKHVMLRYDRINRLIGLDIPRQQILSILDALDMPRIAETDTSCTVTVPTNKADVLREADVIEEILRIYGYNNVPIPTQLRTTAAPAPKPDPHAVRHAVSEYLCAVGFYETMALSLSESRYYRDMLPIFAEEELVYIHNTSNTQLDIMRPSMLFSALETMLHNHNRRQTDLKIFEFGKIYRRQQGHVIEKDRLALALSGQRTPESWIEKSKPADFFTLKNYCVQILSRLGAAPWQESPLEHPAFAHGVRYHRGDRTLAELGKVAPSLTKAMDLRGEVFFADIHWDALLAGVAKQKITYKEPSKYPSVRRDLALIVENSTKFSDIAAIAGKAGKGLLQQVNLFDVYQDEQIIGAGKKSYAVSFVFEDATKTLQDKDVDAIMEQLIKAYESRLGALIRR